MADRWTNEQKEAILSRGQNLLLSAAAGSGKTAVLVGRIIARLTDESAPIMADRLLVVTFTNAAAAEMRERLISSLTDISEKNPENTFYKNQLLLIKKAQITTIDSFCIDLLRKNFTSASLSPDFKIADPTENDVMRDEVLDEILTEMYEDDEYAGDFFGLLEAYANAKANDKTFRELINSLFLFVTSLPDPDRWLCSACDEFKLEDGFYKTKWCDVIISEVKAELTRCIKEYDLMISLAEKDMFYQYEEFLKMERAQFISALEEDGYDNLRSAVKSIVFKTRPRITKEIEPRYFETINEMRDKVKKKRVAKLCEKMLTLSGKEQEDAILGMYPLMRCLTEIVIRLKDRFLSKKLEMNMLDFNDCEHRCLKVLVDENNNPTETAEIVKNQYDEIYIDEYQDTSRLQEAIFSAIKKDNNLFMVGDIKQSIYRFRNTDPSLFSEKRDSFSKDEDAQNRKIILSKNFRSRKNILSSVNFLFERIMSYESGEIDYNEDEKLYFGDIFPEESINPINTDTELCLIDLSSVRETEEIEETEKTELEAFVAANKISELIESEVRIFANGEYRKIRYSDICIISRNVKNTAPSLLNVLSEQGIPCFSENTGGFLNTSEVTTALSILSAIDNPYQDLALISALRSVVFGFSADTLARIRCVDKKVSFYEAMKKCAETDTSEGKSSAYALSVIHSFIEKSKYLSVSELILDIYNSTGFFDAQQARKNGVIKRANLRLLYNRAKEYEKTGFKGLYSFIRFISDYNAAGKDFDAAKTAEAEQDAVRIMSIHKSKGLEFPVVILLGVEKKFNMMDLSASVLFHQKLGYGPKYVDIKRRVKYPFAPSAALEHVLRAEAKAEEMRILYVALTRAKEKLIIIGAENDLKRKVLSCTAGTCERRIPAGFISEKDSYSDWILSALINHPDCEILRGMCDTEQEICKDESKFNLEIIDDGEYFFNEKSEVLEKEKTASSDLDNIIDLVKYSYPYSDTVIPSKVTVTELKARQTLEDDDESFYLFSHEKSDGMSYGTLSGTKLGTAYHTVMQYIDLSGGLDTKEEIKNQITEIKNAGHLTDEEAGSVNPEKIMRFFDTDVGKTLLIARKVHREVMFATLEPAKKLFAETDSDKEIMLQGVVDCVCETDAGLVIIDFKTDKVFRPEDTVKKYKIQLDCYAMAAEKIFKKKVLRKILYLFDTDMGVII